MEGLLPALLLRKQDTVSTPSPHPVDTRYVDETKTRRDVDQDKYKNEDENLYDENFEIREDGRDQLQAEPEEVLRKGKGSQDSAQVLPMESTKRSALAMGGRG